MGQKDSKVRLDFNNKFIKFSDSLSVLKAMKHTRSKNPHSIFFR